MLNHTFHRVSNLWPTKTHLWQHLVFPVSSFLHYFLESFSFICCFKSKTGFTTVQRMQLRVLIGPPGLKFDTCTPKNWHERVEDDLTEPPISEQISSDCLDFSWWTKYVCLHSGHSPFFSVRWLWQGLSESQCGLETATEASVSQTFHNSLFWCLRITANFPSLCDICSWALLSFRATLCTSASVSNLHVSIDFVCN